jgi:hypothetical protein
VGGWAMVVWAVSGWTTVIWERSQI